MAFRIHESVVLGEIDSREKKLLNDEMFVEARKELFETREGILRLMNEFRGRGRT